MYKGFQQILSAIFAEEYRPPGHAAEEARARGVVGDVARPEERPEVHVGLRRVDAEHLRGGKGESDDASREGRGNEFAESQTKASAVLR